MTVRITRRRAITILAAAAGLPLLAKASQAQARMLRWEGTTLGAPSTIQLYHSDEAKARAAIEASTAELARLEAIFSVYRADSAISALNRDGKLDDAPAEFMELVSHAKELARISDGVFDPSIQPVWKLYFEHFTAAHADPAGPSAKDLAAALALVDWRGIQVDTAARRVALARPGMAITLNARAQGYITDKVAAVLRSHGFENVLVDMGEPRAMAAKPDGSAWRIGIANPADPSKAVTEVSVTDKCVSTSGGYGTIFDEAGKFTHIIDARTGKTAPAMVGVTVIADTATIADGLATTLILAPEDKRRAILKAAGALQAIFVTPDGVSATVTV
ncbi:FAD:protein FMN transferase [Paramagnetospirillum kuznetsovii]|uniref:FAD:protein FMN transferase n=1 Tax=Paramagnetospirillum kuznetsovii TaxID=2053833 RepID=A0A364NWV4_9PROT|nr:FAD:protein FMN transferase [Paramagnetospirillum kuznetsovii]RAU21579.1 FAD:protein FMN transferase [Paramagnetospirillum kuznetsovii]